MCYAVANITPKMRHRKKIKMANDQGTKAGYSGTILSEYFFLRFITKLDPFDRQINSHEKLIFGELVFFSVNVSKNLIFRGIKIWVKD